LLALRSAHGSRNERNAARERVAAAEQGDYASVGRTTHPVTLCQAKEI
jgi:hypothetical protein